MQKPAENAVEVTLYANADDGGAGPTQTYADFLPSSAESYEVPAGHTLQIQRIGISLDRPNSGESAWGVLKPIVLDDTTQVFFSPALFNEAVYPPDALAGTWCFFDVFLDVPAEHELELAMDNPNATRGRARFVIRGWLVPDPA